jgi:uncharacterized protein (TIGR03437 family)
VLVFSVHSLHALMLRLLLLLAGFSLPACAQFFGLATPADGSRVYFATPLRQKDTTQPTYGKLFQVDDSGLQLFLMRYFVRPAPLFPGAGYVTNSYNLLAADVSSDGQVFAAAAGLDCTDGFGRAPCVHTPQVYTTITSRGQSQDYPGMLKLSANGQWAFGIVRQSFIPYANLVNVATGEVTTTCGYCLALATSGRSVANDGTAVFFNGEPWLNVQLGAELRRIPVQSLSSDAVIDAAGSTIVFARYVSAAIRELRITSPDATSTDLLAPDGYAPSMTDDGRQVLYLSNRTGTPQAYLINTDGSGDRNLTNEVDGIAQAILSGDGTAAYAVTFGGRLLKISVISATVQELIPRTPFFSNPPSLAPGKLVSVPGVGFSTATYTATPPLPESLGGVRVAIQGIQVRIQSVQPTAITLLVPPDVAFGTAAPIHLETSSSSPFEILDTSVVINQFSPEFLYRPEVYGMLAAAHQDWSGLVSDENPARPGEILHTYGVGIGPTTPSVPYGEAAPSQEPFSRLATPLQCNVEVLFAGLAPALAGIYQIDWRVPTMLAGPSFIVMCQFSGSLAQIYGTVPIGPHL